MTVLLLGDACTRNCRFCAVGHDLTPGALEADEPTRVAEALAALKVSYGVLTSVTRDDLPDGGAAHFAATVAEIRRLSPGTRVELLVPDFLGEEGAIQTIVRAAPEVLSHNLETTRRLTPLVRDRRCDYDRSLAVLRRFGELGLVTKSSLMLGLGEDEAELRGALDDLVAAGVQHLTLGQYLQPSPRQVPVERYWTPEEFEALAVLGRQLGFRSVASGPFVRSSYMAGDYAGAPRT
jgi:lipoic acid synthetase